MAKRGLTNFIRECHVFNGQPTWKLKSLKGEPVLAFNHFCEKNANYSFCTQKRYAEVASRFIDYLCEAQVFEQTVRPGHLNAVIEAFPTLLRDGSSVTASRVRKSKIDLWLAEVAEALDWEPLAPKSFDNTIAAVNRFLRLSESLAREVGEKAALLGVDAQQGYVLRAKLATTQAELGTLRQEVKRLSARLFRAEQLPVANSTSRDEVEFAIFSPSTSTSTVTCGSSALTVSCQSTALLRPVSSCIRQGRPATLAVTTRAW